jgi:lysophospholipase L1-like esterase
MGQYAFFALEKKVIVFKLAKQLRFIFGCERKRRKMGKFCFKAILSAIPLLGMLFSVNAEDVKLLLPETIYAVPGVEMNVYFNNIVTVINPANYVFDVDCEKGYNQLKRWCFTPEDGDVGTYQWKIQIIGQNGTVAEGESKLVVLPRNAGQGKKLSMLMVGASQTNAGHYPNRVAELMMRPGNPEFTSIGTKGTGPGRHEGYGGWRWDSFLTRWGFTGKNTMDGMHPDRPVGFNSPFMFPDAQDASKGVFDLKRYFDKNSAGKIPDIVSFQLGLNDFFLADDSSIAEVTEKSLANMEKLIAEFRKLEPAPKIMIFQHIPGAGQDGFAKSYKCGRTSWQYRKNLDYYNRMLLKKGKELKVTVIPMYINIDTENNYPMLEQQVNRENPAIIQRQDNGVHPAKAGYYQMGDTLFCWIKSLISEQ